MLVVHDILVILFDVDLWLAYYIWNPLNLSAILIWALGPSAALLSVGALVRGKNVMGNAAVLALLVVGGSEFLIPFQWRLPKPQSGLSYYLRKGRVLQEQVREVLSRVPEDALKGFEFDDVGKSGLQLSLLPRDPTYVVISGQKNGGYVSIVFGGGGGHWGLNVGPSWYESKDVVTSQRLWDGVYCFQD